LHWIFEAKKRFGLSVLNYMTTSNHVHLLIKDTGPNVTADSMQLMPGARRKSTTSEKGATAHSGKIATMLPPLRPTNTCIVV
jgi:hypothetical protein